MNGESVLIGVEEEQGGSLCLLPLPTGTAVSRTETDVDTQKGARRSDNSPDLSFPA